MKRRDESRAIRVALAPDSIAGFAGQCHVASVRLVEAAETEGTDLSSMWRRARVARGRHANVPGDHSWVVVDEKRIIDVTLWYYDRGAEPIHRTTFDDPDYHEFEDRTWIYKPECPHTLPDESGDCVACGEAVPPNYRPVVPPSVHGRAMRRQAPRLTTPPTDTGG